MSFRAMPFLLALLLAGAPAIAPAAAAPSARMSAIVADHTCLDVEAIPLKWIDKAKKELRVLYGHTSHGSQVTSGMQAMTSRAFEFDRTGAGGKLAYFEIGGDLGSGGDLRWAQTTRETLARADASFNVIVWSWCGGVSGNDEKGIQAYLDEMERLEREYEGATFVYMTGHLDGTGEKGNLHRRNEQIRAACRKRKAVLFDFADIESHDPDGNAFLALGARDDCSYTDPKTGARRNWAEEWVARHPRHGWSLPDRAAHTHPLNGAMKGRAFWWLLARLAGWDGKPRP